MISPLHVSLSCIRLLFCWSKIPYEIIIRSLPLETEKNKMLTLRLAPGRERTRLVEGAFATASRWQLRAWVWRCVELSSDDTLTCSLDVCHCRRRLITSHCSCLVVRQLGYSHRQRSGHVRPRCLLQVSDTADRFVSWQTIQWEITANVAVARTYHFCLISPFSRVTRGHTGPF